MGSQQYLSLILLPKHTVFISKPEVHYLRLFCITWNYLFFIRIFGILEYLWIICPKNFHIFVKIIWDYFKSWIICIVWDYFLLLQIIYILFVLEYLWIMWNMDYLRLFVFALFVFICLTYLRLFVGFCGFCLGIIKHRDLWIMKQRFFEIVCFWIILLAHKESLFRVKYIQYCDLNKYIQYCDLNMYRYTIGYDSESRTRLSEWQNLKGARITSQIWSVSLGQIQNREKWVQPWQAPSKLFVVPRF